MLWGVRTFENATSMSVTYSTITHLKWYVSNYLQQIAISCPSPNLGGKVLNIFFWSPLNASYTTLRGWIIWWGWNVILLYLFQSSPCCGVFWEKNIGFSSERSARWGLWVRVVYSAHLPPTGSGYNSPNPCALVFPNHTHRGINWLWHVYLAAGISCLCFSGVHWGWVVTWQESQYEKRKGNVTDYLAN